MKACLSNNPTHGRCGGWLLTASIFLAGTLPLAAHVGPPPLSSQGKGFPIGTVQQIVLPTTDIAAELATDTKTGKAAPLRYAVPQPVIFTTTNSGTWEQLPEGRLWRLRLVSTNATDLNFGFTQFWLPDGAALYVISETDRSYQGPYTAADNTPAGQLWTPVVAGEAAVIELLVPDSAKEEPRLVLTQVGMGYRDLFHLRKDGSIPKAGSCEIDVVCPQAAPWANEIRSVGVYTLNGAWTCSGTLIMDAVGDFRPFFLTANHCTINSGNAATVVVYWNYQSAVCGNHGLSPTNSGTTSGATFRAAKTDVDFCLIELSQQPPTNGRPYYAGWDRSGNAPSLAVGIHHPQAGGKCISFSASGLTTIDSCIGAGSSTHWQVPWYDGGTYGVTEPGSSGSGIFDANSHQLVGTLSGGPSSCTTTSGNFWDCYGKFALAWASGSSSADRLQDWLDPQQGIGVMSVAGSDPFPSPVVTLAGTSLAAEGCPPGNGAVDPGEVVTVNFSLQDTGTAPTTNLVATLLATNGVTPLSGPQAYGALPAGGAAVARGFTFVPTGACGGSFTAVLQLQDGPRSFGRVAQNFTLGAFGGSPITTTYSSGGIATPIPDVSTVEVPLAIGDTGGITDVNVSVRLNHTYDSDLVISLVHPDGTVVSLASNRGGSSDNYGSGATDCSGTSTVFDDAAGTPIGSGSAPFASTYRPEGLLSALNGKPVTGTWKLRVADTASVDTGTIYCFQLIITRQSYACCTTAPRPILSAVGYNRTNQTFQFSVTGTKGYSYAVQYSTNLSDWVTLSTNVSPFTFTHSNSPAFPERFYRTRYP